MKQPWARKWTRRCTACIAWPWSQGTCWCCPGPKALRVSGQRGAIKLHDIPLTDIRNTFVLQLWTSALVWSCWTRPNLVEGVYPNRVWIVMVEKSMLQQTSARHCSTNQWVVLVLNQIVMMSWVQQWSKWTHHWRNFEMLDGSQTASHEPRDLWYHE